MSGLALAPVAQADVGDEITGTVWQDYDSNGMFDTFEDGLAGSRSTPTTLTATPRVR